MQSKVKSKGVLIDNSVPRLKNILAPISPPTLSQSKIFSVIEKSSTDKPDIAQSLIGPSVTVAPPVNPPAIFQSNEELLLEIEQFCPTAPLAIKGVKK